MHSGRQYRYRPMPGQPPVIDDTVAPSTSSDGSSGLSSECRHVLSYLRRQRHRDAVRRTAVAESGRMPYAGPRDGPVFRTAPASYCSGDDPRSDGGCGRKRSVYYSRDMPGPSTYRPTETSSVTEAPSCKLRRLFIMNPRPEFFSQSWKLRLADLPSPQPPPSPLPAPPSPPPPQAVPPSSPQRPATPPPPPSPPTSPPKNSPSSGAAAKPSPDEDILEFILEPNSNRVDAEVARRQDAEDDISRDLLLLCLTERGRQQGSDQADATEETLIGRQPSDGRPRFGGLFLFYGNVGSRTVSLSQAYCLSATNRADFQASLTRLIVSSRVSTICCTNLKAFCHLVASVASEDKAAADASEELLQHLSQRVLDLPLAHFLLEPDKPLDDAHSLLLRHLPGRFDPAAVSTLPLREQAFLIGRLWWRLERRLRQVGMFDLFSRLESPLVPLIYLMERTGVRVDKKRLVEMKAALEARLERLKKDIYEAGGESFCINSPLQLKNLLYKKLRLHERLTQEELQHSGLAKSVADQSTRQEVLMLMAPKHPLPALVVAYRRLHRTVSVCCEGYQEFVESDGRIRPVWDQRSAVTGRLYSSLPNLQGLPRQCEDATDSDRYSVRACFPAGPGRRLLAIDYRHVELRIFAHLTDDARLKAAFSADADVFVDLARVCLDKSADGEAAEVTAADRDVTKRLVYATMYGACQQKLTEILSSAVSIGQVKRMYEALQRSWPTPFEYFRRVARQAANSGDSSVSTVMGRRRCFAGMDSSSPSIRARAQRQAVNFTIQGSAADLCKLAMLRCWEAAREQPSLRDARLVLHLHDELVWDVAESEADRAGQEFGRVMEDLAQRVGLSVPLRVRTRCGEDLAFN